MSEPSESSETEINQVSLYLLREDVGSFADALRQAADEVVPVAGVAGLQGELHLVAKPLPRPRWLPFLRSISGRALPDPQGQRLSAVLFLDRNGHRFALTFGLGRHLLR